MAFGQTPTDEWRSQNDKDDRYEGTRVKVEVANPRIELVSFIAGSIPSTLRSTTLHLFFYPTHQAPVRVWARERDVKEGYWMEPKAPAGGWKANQWNAFCTWPSAEIDRINLPPSNLGVIARLDGDHPRSGTVAPVIVTTAGQPLPQSLSDYEASFRLGIRSARISYAVMDGCKSFKRLSGDLVGIKNGGDVFSIRFKTPEKWSGEASLVITAAPLDKSPPDERRFCFSQPSTPPTPACAAK